MSIRKPWNKGKHLSNEHKRNLSLAHQGYTPKTAFKKGHIPWNKGKKTQILKKCIVCFKEFFIRNKAKNRGKFCSIECRNKYQKGKNHPMWKGGKFFNCKGYVYIYQPSHPFANADGYIFEHRIIMEEYLKRFLKLTEVVHHINGNPSDNRIKNLMLFRNNKEHKKFHSYPK